jgi:hypothetical protein
MAFEADLSWYMAGTYVSSIYIMYDVLLEAYVLDVLVNEFGISLSYILGHVFGELTRWFCCTSLMIHSLIYS